MSNGYGSTTESGRTVTHSTHVGGGMPRRGGIGIHIRVSLYVWFCDHSGWWGVWVVDAAPPWEEGLTFGVVGDIHIRVCMSLPVIKESLQLPPRFAPESRSP